MPRGRQALLQEIEIAALHEPTPTAHGPTHLIAEMGSRIAPVGFDAERFKKDLGDLALRCSGEGAVKRLKHEAPPTGPRIGRVERITEIAIRDEIGQSAQEQKATLDDIRGRYRIGKKSNPIEDAAAAHRELNPARGVREKDMLYAVRGFESRNAAAELAKVQHERGVGDLPRLSQKRKHKGGWARLPEDIGIEGGAARIFERIGGRMWRPPEKRWRPNGYGIWPRAGSPECLD